MQVHASCAAREGAAVLLVGPPGSGKSDLLLRMLDRGFSLVADDRVEVADGHACAPPALAGLLEVRGLGILRLPFTARARLALVLELGPRPERLPAPRRHPQFGVPVLALDPAPASAPAVAALALDCALGRIPMHAGAFGDAS